LVSTFQNLSEPFIREFKDKVDWEWISIYQTLSDLFIFEFINVLEIKLILKYQKHLSPETKNKIELIHKLIK
jgi:hypothetical protein